MTPTTLRGRVAEVLDATNAAYGASGEVRIAQGLTRVLEAAHREAAQLGDGYVSTEHLLLALDDAGDRTAGGAARVGITRDAILDGLKAVRGVQRVDLAGPRVDLRGAREVRPRPDGAGT